MRSADAASARSVAESDRSSTGRPAIRVAKSTHAPFAFTGRLVAVFGPIVHAGSRLLEHVPDAGQLRNIGFRGQVAVQLIGDDLARLRAGAQHAQEEAFGRSVVAPLLQKDVEFDAIFVDRAPKQVRLRRAAS